MESPVLEDLYWLKFEAPIFEGLVSGVIASSCGGGFDFRLDDRSEWSHFAFSHFQYVPCHLCGHLPPAERHLKGSFILTELSSACDITQNAAMLRSWTL